MDPQHRTILMAGIIAAVVGLVAGFIGGRLVPQPIPAPAPMALMRAQAFKVVDQAGRDRGVLGIDADGAARMALFGQEAALPLVDLAAYPRGGATLQLTDPQGARAVVLKTDPGGSRELSIYAGDKIRLKLEVQKNGDPAVELYDRGSRLITWYLGGLNFQTTHHLFPKVCHVHYPHLSRIIERVCREHGVRFLSQPSLAGAIRSHYRFLRSLATPPVPCESKSPVLL